MFTLSIYSCRFYCDGTNIPFTNLSEVLLEFHATAVTRLPRILEDILCREDFLQAFNLFLTQTSRKMTRYC